MIDLATKQLRENSQTLKKIRLEQRLSRVIMNNYAELVREFDALYPATGSAPAIETVAQSTQASLEAHYLIVQRQFEGEVTQDLGEPVPEAAMNLGAFAFGVWIAERSLFNATRIIATARNRILTSIEQARQAMADEIGNVVPNQQALDQGKRIAAPILRRQALTVGNTETQASAEATKTFVAEAAGGVVPRNAAGVPGPLPAIGDDIIITRKTWGTQRDEQVRGRHVITDGQQRSASDLYDVGGQSLMFPGDTSNGADLSNVIRCRCFSFYGESDCVMGIYHGNDTVPFMIECDHCPSGKWMLKGVHTVEVAETKAKKIGWHLEYGMAYCPVCAKDKE